VGITSPGPGTTLGGVETVFEPEPIRTQKSWNYRVVAEVRRTWILTQRTALIIRRNVMLTGLRLLTYGATSVLLATVWLHMEKTDARVNDRISVHFFSLAVLSGMSVAAVPLYLEERPVFIRERNNGLYGAGVYTIANTVVFIPYLFVCAVLYSCVRYVVPFDACSVHCKHGATRAVTGRSDSNRMLGHFVVSYPTYFSACTLLRPRPF